MRLSGSSRSAHHAMTLDEALKIEANASSGVLDISLAGTQNLVDQAHRVHVNALLWGGVRRDSSPRRVRGGIAMGIGMVLVTLAGFCLTFVAGR